MRRVSSRLDMEAFSWIGKFSMFAKIITFYLSSVNCESFKRDDSVVSYANFVSNPFSKLISKSFLAIVQVSSLGECTLKCINHRECVSVNFGHQNQGRHTCELINRDKFIKPHKFTVSQDFHYYHIKVR